MKCASVLLTRSIWQSSFMPTASTPQLAMLMYKQRKVYLLFSDTEKHSDLSHLKDTIDVLAVRNLETTAAPSSPIALPSNLHQN